MKKIILLLCVTFIGLITMSQNLDQSHLITEVKKWMGTPYKWGGKTMRGIDCSQFNKRLSADVYKIDIENTCITQW